jgi:hypothetical protein
LEEIYYSTYSIGERQSRRYKIMTDNIFILKWKAKIKVVVAEEFSEIFQKEQGAKLHFSFSSPENKSFT